jgi:hypothetical protein
MTHIDHFSISAANIFQASNDLREQTGLGFYDGGYFAGGNANKIFPLGEQTYLEIGGFIDAYAVQNSNRPKPWWFEKIRSGDCFTGLCLRVDSLDELKEIAARKKVKFPDAPDGRIRPDGTTLNAYSVPTAGVTWSKGLPNWYYHPVINLHPSGQPIIGTTDLVLPQGISFIEMGGTEKAMTEWLGQPASDFPFKFNGKAPGLYAIGVKSDRGEITIRRPSATEA